MSMVGDIFAREVRDKSSVGDGRWSLWSCSFFALPMLFSLFSFFPCLFQLFSFLLFSVRYEENRVLGYISSYTFYVFFFQCLSSGAGHFTKIDLKIQHSIHKSLV